MSKFLSNTAHDEKLEVVRASTEVHICTGDPANRAAVITNSLGSYTPTYTAITNGSANVRRTTTLLQETGVIVSAGVAATLCHIDGSELLAKTDIAGTPTLQDGQSITVNASDIDSLQAV